MGSVLPGFDKRELHCTFGESTSDLAQKETGAEGEAEMIRLTMTASIAIALRASGAWTQDVKGAPEALVGVYGNSPDQEWSRTFRQIAANIFEERSEGRSLKLW